MLIPLIKIELCIAYHLRPNSLVHNQFSDQTWNSPAIAEAHEWAVQNGLLVMETNTGGDYRGTMFNAKFYLPTPKLHAYIEHLKAQPLPVATTSFVTEGVSTGV